MKTINEILAQDRRKRKIRAFLRELPYVLGTMACFAFIGVLLAWRG